MDSTMSDRLSHFNDGYSNGLSEYAPIPIGTTELATLSLQMPMNQPHCPVLGTTWHIALLYRTKHAIFLSNS